MAALFHAFPSTPPVVRRRSKELLEIIRDAVKKGLSSAVEGPGEAVVVEPSGVTLSATKTDDDGFSASTPPVPQPPPLWSHDKALPTATASSLFGASVLPPQPRPTYSAVSSSLFGSLPPSGVTNVNASSRFQDIVKKIHSTLVIAPTAPTVRTSR
jgi:exosome complex exonuclease RRP6